MSIERILNPHIARTLSLQKEYLTAEHREHLVEEEQSGDSSTWLDNDLLVVTFPSMNYNGPWDMDVLPGMPEAARAIGWDDLAAILELALANGIDCLHFTDGTPPFDDDAALGLTRYES